MNISNIPFGCQQSHFTGKPDILPGGFTFDKEYQKLSVGDIVSAGTLGICDELNRTIRIIKTARVSNISEDGTKVELCTYPYNDPCFKVGERVYKADCTNVDFSTVPKIEKIKQTGVYVLYLSCSIPDLKENDIIEQMVESDGIAVEIGKADCLTIRDIELTDLDAGVDVTQSTGMFSAKEKLIPPIPNSQKDPTGKFLIGNPHIKLISILE